MASFILMYLLVFLTFHIGHMWFLIPSFFFWKHKVIFYILVLETFVIMLNIIFRLKFKLIIFNKIQIVIAILTNGTSDNVTNFLIISDHQFQTQMTN